MIEEIKNLPASSGIYLIKSPTGLVYIGEAKNLKSRCLGYINPKNVKNQRAIYNSLIKHGVESHKIEVLELCQEEKLLERERYYQELYNSVNNGLNCFLTGTSDKKKRWSEETKKIMSNNCKGAKNHFFAKKHTKETLMKMSERSRGRNNPNWNGKFLNEEYLKKQVESNSKKPIRLIDVLTGQVIHFKNSKECAKHLGCSPSSVRMSKNSYLLRKRYKIEDLDINNSL